MTDAMTAGDKRVKARKPSKEKTPRTAAAPPTKARRRPMIIAAGVALAVVGGLGSWAYATSTGDTQTVLVTSTDVRRPARTRRPSRQAPSDRLHSSTCRRAHS